MAGARQLPIEDGWIGVTQLQIDKLCAVKLDNSAFSAVELYHSSLRTCARELDNSG